MYCGSTVNNPRLLIIWVWFCLMHVLCYIYRCILSLCHIVIPAIFCYVTWFFTQLADTVIVVAGRLPSSIVVVLAVVVSMINIIQAPNILVVEVRPIIGIIPFIIGTPSLGVIGIVRGEGH